MFKDESRPTIFLSSSGLCFSVLSPCAGHLLWRGSDARQRGWLWSQLPSLGGWHRDDPAWSLTSASPGLCHKAQRILPEVLQRQCWARVYLSGVSRSNWPTKRKSSVKGSSSTLHVTRLLLSNRIYFLRFPRKSSSVSRKPHCDAQRNPGWRAVGWKIQRQKRERSMRASLDITRCN